MKAVEISVTAEHINTGEQCSSDSDAVALAIMEALHPLSIDVTAEFIHFGLPGGRYSPVVTPEEVSYWVDEFDDGLPVQPFTFTLEVPDEVTAA